MHLAAMNHIHITCPWISGNFTLSPPQPPPQLQPPSSSSFRVFCRSQFSSKDLKFVLHDALHSSGTNITHAQAARDGFKSQILKLSEIERETSICIDTGVDLGKTALYIAAEDDSLMSHSSVPLPVDAFLERLDNLSTSYCPHYRPSLVSSPEDLLDSIERFLHSVVICRYSILFIRRSLNAPTLRCNRFDVEIYHPHDLLSLPRAYNKKKEKESDQNHILHQNPCWWRVLIGHFNKVTLRFVLKGSNCSKLYKIGCSHRLDRGVWTSVLFGDMRRALSACERLILLESNAEELRDYAVLLYHCTYYEEALQYLKHKVSLNNSAEDEAVEKLIVRLNLIMMEEGWKRPSKSFFRNNSEPW
ncbi:Uncharacterized protein RDABS01_039994 [Bienertia sinuspersici]